MNTNERIEQLEKELAELKAALAKSEWPSVGDVVYTSFSNGETPRYNWTIDEFQPKWKQRGLIFRTEEEAKRYDERRILIQEIREFAGHYKPVWDGKTNNWYLLFDVSTGNIEAASRSFHDSLTICGYFKDDRTAQAAIKHFGDRLNLLREV